MTSNEIFAWALTIYGAIRLAMDFAMWIEPKRKVRR